MSCHVCVAVGSKEVWYCFHFMLECMTSNALENLHLVEAKVCNRADLTVSCRPYDIFFWIVCAVKVGIPEFLQGIGGGVEAHVAKLESEIGDFNRLLVSRTLKLKKLGIPCKHVNCLPCIITHSSF